jgi:putative NIF3 family GTP cyclohydrolase 1 type 2
MTAREIFALMEKDAGPQVFAAKKIEPAAVREPPTSYLLVDGFKAGNPDANVTGIVVAARADMNTLRRAVAVNANLVITRSPFQYDMLDRLPPNPEPVAVAKRDYIAQHQLVVLRFHDPRSGAAGEAITSAMADGLGLRLTRKDGGPDHLLVFETAPTTVVDVVRRLKQTLPTKTVRLIGSANMPVRGIGFAGDTYRPNAVLPGIARPDVDLFVSAELHETEVNQYVLDSIHIGRPKALVLVGAIQFEEPAARKMASWLKTLVPAVATTHVAGSDPFVNVD